MVYHHYKIIVIATGKITFELLMMKVAALTVQQLKNEN